MNTYSYKIVPRVHGQWNIKMKPLKQTAFAAVLSITASGASWAAGTVDVPLGQASVIHISANPAQIVIGNPAIADVTMQSSKTLVVFGKYPGGTNLLLLDRKGNPILETTLLVTPSNAGGVTVYYGSGKNWVPGGAAVSVACAADHCGSATGIPHESIYKANSGAATAPSAPINK